jgi:phosphopantetheinyl transferase
MPLDKIEIYTEQKRARAVWRIEEDEQTLATLVAPFEQITETITHPAKRLEWLAGRVLVKLLMQKLELNFKGVVKNEFGKPFPAGSSFQLALSHSYPYVAALMDENTSVGIDLEQPKSKLLKIAPRVLDADELADAGNDLVKHCIYWCAKETLIKVYGKKDLTFAENLKINSFNLQQQGDMIGRIIVSGIETIIPLKYHVTEKFVLVWSEK